MGWGMNDEILAENNRYEHALRQILRQLDLPSAPEEKLARIREHANASGLVKAKQTLPPPTTGLS